MMDKLEAMNYRDLQKLAKSAGVRANLPKAELLRVLQDHQSQPTAADAAAGHTDNVSIGSLLNTTFEVDPSAEEEGTGAESAAAVAAALDISDDNNANDSLLTNDGEGDEKSKLNGTFEVVNDDDEGGIKRRSSRLSVSGLTTAALAKEVARSPMVKPSTAAARRLQVPSRRSVVVTPRAEAAKRSTLSDVIQRITTPSASKRKQPEESVSNIPRFVKFSR